jgi:hypothetical protein
MPPIVSVNGEFLGEGELLTLRVALCSLIEDMRKPYAIGRDKIGREIAEGYIKCAQEILSKMESMGK